MQLREAETVHKLHVEVQKREVMIQSNNDQLQQCQRQEREHRSQNWKLKQQLEEQEQITAEIQQANHSLQSQVEKLQQQLTQQICSTTNFTQPQIPPIALRDTQLQQDKVKYTSTSTKNLFRKIIEWKVRGKAPISMSRGASIQCRWHYDLLYTL